MLVAGSWRRWIELLKKLEDHSWKLRSDESLDAVG